MFSGWGARHDDGDYEKTLMIIMRNLIMMMRNLIMIMMGLMMLIMKKATLTGLLRRTQQVRGTARPVVGDH